MVCVGNTAIISTGRLLEIRISLGFRTAEYVANHFADIDAEVMRRPPSERIVIAADWRSCQVMSAAASEALVANLTRNNPRIERSAIVASVNGPSAMLQFTRLVRESANPQRRLFTDAGEMAQWLALLREVDRVRRIGSSRSGPGAVAARGVVAIGAFPVTDGAP
ncbi:MAG: hypothetical protein ABTD50_17840, partial [Polyangiaceae bacterium]